MKKAYISFSLLTLAIGAAAQKRSKYQVVNFLNSISDKQTLSGKPMTIGECEVIPGAEILRTQPKWTFCIV